MIDQTIHAVIFDVDGTLVRSNDAHAAAWSRAFAACGYFDVIPPIVRPLVGKAGPDLIRELKPNITAQECTRIQRHHGQIFAKDYLPKLRPTRGARELVLALIALDIDIIAVSSARVQELKPLLIAAHVDDLVRQYVTADDVLRAKPAPDSIEVALEKMHCSRQEAMMVGDTIYDIEAARRASVRIVALRCGNTPERLLAQADAVFNDPLDLAVAFPTLSWGTAQEASSYAQSA